MHLCRNRRASLGSLISILIGIAFPFCAGAEKQPTESVKIETGYFYTIQKGDTLWDLSGRFYDSPWQWPALWEENPHISNPHWIYPGEQIRLLPLELFARPDLSRPESETRKEKRVPPEREPAVFVYTPIDSVGFIRKPPAVASGAIFHVDGEKTILSTGDLIYIKPNGDASFSTGDLFKVYRTFGPTGKRSVDAELGLQHYFSGVVEITKVEPSFSVARVVRAYRNIELNDQIMPYIPRSPKITLLDAPEGCYGTIIASEEHASEIGSTHIAFIDKGKREGVAVGQRFAIYYQDEARPDPEKKESILLSPVEAGTILVLHTEETTATVLVAKTTKNINPGALFCTPFK